jgi:hypothetical protein
MRVMYAVHVCETHTKKYNKLSVAKVAQQFEPSTPTPTPTTPTTTKDAGGDHDDQRSNAGDPHPTQRRQ